MTPLKTLASLKALVTKRRKNVRLVVICIQASVLAAVVQLPVTRVQVIA